ncbi:response regulator [Zobellella sp. DQSA1]|uniref:response regulator transcription factor n=1 Tax=Zobellella sp. DQSA1 TaxID=3342386 RepID=UPI0035BF62E2
MAHAHILLIDDHPEDLIPLVTLLRSAGMRVSLSDSSRQGYQRALALTPDLIVLDLHMPGMDGFSVCRLLREAPALQATPIIFLSASNTLEERLTGLQLGGVDFVTKPYAPEEMLARIRVHLRLRRQHGKGTSGLREETRTDKDELLLRAATRLILEDLAAPPALAELARAMGTHEKRLLKIFRDRLNMTVFAFVREARLQKAKELLASHQLSVEDVAALIGFSSAANFATAFKSREGITPREYRNLYRQTDGC